MNINFRFNLDKMKFERILAELQEYDGYTIPDNHEARRFQWFLENREIRFKRTFLSNGKIRFELI